MKKCSNKEKETIRKYRASLLYKSKFKIYFMDYLIKNPDKRLKYSLKRFNITVEQYNRILLSQNSNCGICGINQSVLKQRLSVDHDHNCCTGALSCGKCIRGLLCRDCNLMLGHAKDSTEIIKKSLSYLSCKRNLSFSSPKM